MNYWTEVMRRAAALLDANPEMTGDTAYYLARRQLDQEGAQPPLAEADYTTLELKP